MNEKIELNDLIMNKQQNEVQSNDLINILALNELTSNKKIKTNSRIKLEQVELISKLYLFNDTFKAPMAKKLADSILQLQVSINGLGRKELIQMVNNNQDIIQPNKRLKDVFR